MVVRRAIMTIQRGTWNRDYDGFVFTINAKGATCWYFVPDVAQTAGLATFYQHLVRLRGPAGESKFQPKRATLLPRSEAEDLVKHMTDALEGLL